MGEQEMDRGIRKLQLAAGLPEEPPATVEMWPPPNDSPLARRGRTPIFRSVQGLQVLEIAVLHPTDDASWGALERWAQDGSMEREHLDGIHVANQQEVLAYRQALGMIEADLRRLGRWVDPPAEVIDLPTLRPVAHPDTAAFLRTAQRRQIEADINILAASYEGRLGRSELDARLEAVAE